MIVKICYFYYSERQLKRKTQRKLQQDGKDLEINRNKVNVFF